MNKSGIEYFPLACYFDDKLELIEAEFGLEGIAIVVKLYQRIYGELGYYCDWNDEVALLFSRKACALKEGRNVVSEVIKSALKRGIFNEEKYREYSILTSAGIQKRYFEAAKRRTEIEVEKDYLLLSDDKIPSNVYINQKNVYRNPKNVYRNAQRKVKESKVKESKECSSTLTQVQIDSLVNQFGANLVEEYIVRTKKYKCCNYYTILKWIKEDSTNRKVKSTQKATSFNSFPQRDYNFEELEKKLLKSSLEKRD